jgi:hypothetical protein
MGGNDPDQKMHTYEVRPREDHHGVDLISRPRKDKRGVELILSRQRACQLAVFFGKLPHENNSSVHCWFTDCHCSGAGRSCEWYRVGAGSRGHLNGRHNYQMGLRPDGVVVWRWSPYH